MNLGISNNEVLQNYYALSIPEKREELYNEIYELTQVMNVLLKAKYDNIELPPIENLDNIKNGDIEEDLYLTGLYEDLVVFKEMFAYYFDDEE